MNFTSIKYELQHILQGKSHVSYGESIQAIAGFLRESHSASTTAQGNEPNKPEETKRLIHYTPVWADVTTDLTEITTQRIADIYTENIKK